MTPTDQLLNLKGDCERPEVFAIRKIHPTGPAKLTDRLQEVEDLELQGVLFVDEEVFHERGLLVPNRFAVQDILGRGSPMDMDFLIRVIKKDVGVGLADGESPNLVLRRPARGNRRQRPILEFDLDIRDVRRG